MNTIRVSNTLNPDQARYFVRKSNSLDPDQARHFVGLDLDSDCLQSLSADDTSRQRVKIFLN